ncbi:MAG TPA: glycosyltransferase family 39 protein [Planctomycetaceae bacterium]|nr:glycosyltransferase family 39 protein [Planctomycetaceae bacterium]
MRFWLPAIGLLAVHAALGITAAGQLTTTHDEYWHLPIGLLNVKTGRFDFDDLNPPLCRMLAALPLTLTSARTGDPGAQHDPQGWGDVFIDENHEHYQRWFTLGRSMMVLLSVAGGLALALWARELFGNGAGILAAIFWAFEPNLIAHGSLVTTDMGAAAFFVFTLFAAWRFARRPGWRAALLFGVLLGLAQLAKFTSLVLYPISIAVFLLAVVALRDRRELAGTGAFDGRQQWARIAGLWALTLFVSVLVLNAGYLFRGSFSTLQSYDFQSSAIKRTAAHLSFLGNCPVPLPRDYLTGLDHQRRIMEQKHPVYLNGEWSEEGFPGYYAWALLYKLPHALQLLALVALLWTVMPGGLSRPLAFQAMILLPAIVMLGVAESSPMQLGIRYVLPVIPFVILYASQVGRWLNFRTYPVRTTTWLVLTIAMVLSVRYHPEDLAYFNEFAGGPIGGREHLLDSNLDWGQDLRGLKMYLDAQSQKRAEAGLPPQTEIGLAYFGTVPPAALGIRYHIPPGGLPRAGRFAVSVNFEQGRPHWVRTPEGKIRPVNINEFLYFRFFRPVARIGASIDVFDLSESEVAEFRAEVDRHSRH